MIIDHVLQSFPRLEIIPLKDLLVYEAFDPVRVEYLTKKIAHDNIFLQPIIVGESPMGERIVLDGVNRREVLRRLDVHHVVAHVVSYFDQKEVELFSNRHYFFSNEKNLFTKIEKIFQQPLEKISLEQGESGILDQRLIGYVKVEDAIFSFGAHNLLNTTVDHMNAVVSSYLGQTEFCRQSEMDMGFSRVPLQIGFRRFTPQEIVDLSVQGKKVNSGITRHLVSVYCIGLHIPLSLLQSDLSSEEKNKELQKILYNLVKNRAYRFYPRPIYKFDEKE